MVVSVDERGRLAGDVALATSGVIDELIDAHVLAAARNEAAAAVDELADGTAGKLVDDPALSEAARHAVRRAFARVLGFKPVTTATVLRLRG